MTAGSDHSTTACGAGYAASGTKNGPVWTGPFSVGSVQVGAGATAPGAAQDTPTIGSRRAPGALSGTTGAVGATGSTRR